MANEYVDAATLTATLNMTGETFAVADITAACTSASRAIETLCDRRFWADSNASQVRVYTALNHPVLIIDDLVTLTSLKVDRNADGTFEETWTVATDFTLEPGNAVVDGRPYSRVKARPNSVWPLVDQGVQITGKFGWSAVPAAVVDATTILAIQLVKRKREAPFGVMGIGADGYAVRLAKSDPHIEMLLTPFMRLLI